MIRIEWPTADPSTARIARTRQPRWVWREIWNHLAHGGDADQAAATFGAIAGLGRPEVATSPTFALLAEAFLELVDDPSLSWRCAWPGDNSTSSWLDRFSTAVTRYGRTAGSGALATVARIRGATHDGAAVAILDLVNLRTWVWHEDACVEPQDPDPSLGSLMRSGS